MNDELAALRARRHQEALAREAEARLMQLADALGRWMARADLNDDERADAEEAFRLAQAVGLWPFDEPAPDEAQKGPLK